MLAEYKASKDITSFQSYGTYQNFILGDSHTQCAISDSDFKRTKNLSKSGEAYIYTYHKLKLLSESNPQIDTVVMGLSYHNLSFMYEDFIDMDKILKKSIFLMPKVDRMNILESKNYSLFFYLRSCYSLIKQWALGPERVDWIGFHNPLDEALKLDKIKAQERSKFHFYENGEPYGFSPSQFEYLERIVALCKKKNIELLLFNIPIHDYYYNEIPKQFIDKLEHFKRSNKTEIYSFDQLEFSNSEFSPDGDHLNVLGAKKLTEYVQKRFDLN